MFRRTRCSHVFIFPRCMWNSCQQIHLCEIASLSFVMLGLRRLRGTLWSNPGWSGSLWTQRNAWKSGRLVLCQSLRTVTPLRQDYFRGVHLFIYFLLLWGILKKIKTANKLWNAGIFWLNPSVTCDVTVGCLLCYFRPFSHAFCDIFMLERWWTITINSLMFTHSTAVALDLLRSTMTSSISLVFRTWLILEHRYVRCCSFPL